MLSAGEQSRNPLKSLRSLHANQKPWLISGGLNQPLDWSMYITFPHPYPSRSTSRRHLAPERWIQLTMCFQTAQIHSAHTFTCLRILYLQQANCSWFLVYCISRNPQTMVRAFFFPFPQHSVGWEKKCYGILDVAICTEVITGSQVFGSQGDKALPARGKQNSLCSSGLVLR